MEIERNSNQKNEKQLQSETVSEKSEQNPANRFHDEIMSRYTDLKISSVSHPSAISSPERLLSTLSLADKNAIFVEGVFKTVNSAIADSVIGTNNVHLNKDTVIPIPKAVETVGVGAAIGFASRTLLPGMGVWGKLGNAALGVALVAPVAKNALDAYTGFRHAQTAGDLSLASQELGQLMGGSILSFPMGIAAFKGGSHVGEGLLRSPSMDTFNAAKLQKFDAVNDWMAEKINDGAAAAKKFALGENRYPGSHGVAEQFPRITDSLRNGIKGTDYPLPTVKLPENIGKDANVLVVTGHGVEAPEFTEVVKAMRDAGAEVTVATPDWTWEYQPKDPGKVTLAQWLDNGHVLQGDISVSNASKLMSEGKFDAMYIPGGAGNTAAIRTDASIQSLVRQSLKQNLDTWTICHGGQVFISALEKNSGIRMTGSGDITAQDLPNAGFVVPGESVVFDSAHKVLSGKDPSVLNEFISAIGDRFKSIQEAKNLPPRTIKNFSTPVELLSKSIEERSPVPSASEIRYPGPAPSYPRGLSAELPEAGATEIGYPSGLDSWKRTGPRDSKPETSVAKVPAGDTTYPQNNPNYPMELGGPRKR